jgi:hypothetical protein
MKSYIAIGVSTVAVIAGGGGYVIAESGGPTPSDTGVSDAIAKEGEQAKSEVQPEAAPSASPAEQAEKALQAKVEQVRIGASYEEAHAVLGAADWSEEQSTDFGHDVIYWYGGWAVYTTDAVVTSVTYYESEA